MQGSFVASKACPAFLSIKKQSNPGNVSVAPGQSYMLLGKNKDEATYYWVEVKEAQPRQRWVAVDCGSVNDHPAGGGSGTSTAASTAAAPATTTATQGSAAGKASGKGAPFYVLALSWEPAFCLAMQDKVECKGEQPGGYDATHLSLHGLWPQPRRNEFCNVADPDRANDEAHRWEALPEPRMSAATKAALDHVMPGTQSLLERHEYLRHGTCYPADADTYFKDAARLAEEVNNSAVAAFLAANVGKTVQTADLRAKFDEAFGAGAGQRLRVACKGAGGRRLISELTLGLKGDIPSGAPLRGLLAAATATAPGCPSGILDAAGSQ
jgi:ribonuclease T2